MTHKTRLQNFRFRNKFITINLHFRLMYKLSPLPFFFLCLFYKGVQGDRLWLCTVKVLKFKHTHLTTKGQSFIYLVVGKVFVFLFTKVIKSLCHNDMLYSCHCEQLLGNLQGWPMFIQNNLGIIYKVNILPSTYV